MGRKDGNRFVGLPARCGDATSEFDLGDMVRPVAAGEDDPNGLVTAIQVCPDGFAYAVSYPGRGGDVYHYGFELELVAAAVDRLEPD